MPFERKSGNRFEVDVDLKVELVEAVAKDELESTVDLAEVYEIVKQEVEADPSTLIETVAGKIAENLLKIDGVQSSMVRVRKLYPPIPGAVTGVMEAEVTRES